MKRAVKTGRLLHGPESPDRHRCRQRRPRGCQQRRGKRTQGPEKRSIRIMRIDVVGLRHEPDVRSEQKHTEQKQGLGDERSPGLRDPDRGRIGKPHRTEQDHKAGALGHLGPVGAHEGQGAGTDQDGAEHGNDRRKTARWGRHADGRENPLPVLCRDETLLDPRVEVTPELHDIERRAHGQSGSAAFDARILPRNYARIAALRKTAAKKPSVPCCAGDSWRKSSRPQGQGTRVSEPQWPRAPTASKSR